MGIRQYKPTTPGRRRGSVSDFADITDRKKKPEKSLLRPKPKKGGRNNQGIVCTRFRGGGHKQQYRVIDFKRRKDNVSATVSVDRVRPEPLGPHRPAPVRGRREGVHPGAGGAEGRRQGRSAAENVGAARRQLHAAEEDPAGHDDPQPGDAARPRRPALPQRRHQRHADRPRRQVGPDHAAVRRGAPHVSSSAGRRSARSATPST